MTTVTIVDPQGTKRKIPMDVASQALQAGGKFASDADKSRAMAYQDVSQRFSGMPEWLKTGLLGTAESLQDKPAMRGAVDTGGEIAGGVEDIAQDIGRSVASAPGAAVETARGIPQHLRNLGQYYSEHGAMAGAGQAALGGGELVSKLLSAFPAGARYASSKFAPDSAVAQGLAKIPTPYELLMQGEEAAGLAPTAVGESEARGVGELALGGAGLRGLTGMGSRVGAIGTAAAGGGGDPIHAAMGALFGEKAGGALARQPQRFSEWRELSKSDPEALQADVKAQTKAVDLLQKHQGLEAELEQIPDPTTKLPDLSFETSHAKLQDLSQQSTDNLAKAHSEQANNLGAGQDFETQAAPLVIKGVEDIKGQISPRYKAINEASKDIIIDVPNKPRAQEIQTNMDQMIKQGVIAPMNDSIYDSILGQLEEQWPGSDVVSIPAPQYINTYKSTRDLARIARQRSRQEGIDQTTRQQWQEKANKLEPVVKEQKQILQEELPDNLFDDLLETDKLWAENVIPFYRSKIYQDSRNNGLAPKNMIDQTAGEAPHRRIMQNLIKNNPELNRLAIAQKYAEKPHEIINPDERYAPYIEAHPKTKRLQEVQQRYHGSTQKAQEQLENLQSKRIEREKQQEGVSQKTKQQIAQRQALTKKIESIKSDIEGLNKEIGTLDQEIAKKGLSEERLKRKQKLEQRRRRLKSEAWRSIKTASAYAIGGKLITSALRALFG